MLLERRMRGNSHVRCEVGENPEITSKDYLSLFCGVYNGKPICFELKSTENKTSFPFGNIKNSQIEFFNKWVECGGIGYYLIRFAVHSKVFMINAMDMHDIINNIDRKSVKYDYCLEDERFIELNYDNLNFEDYIKGV